jgi:hypothetical protein
LIVNKTEYYNENWGKNGHREKIVHYWGKNGHWEKKDTGKKRVRENLSLNPKINIKRLPMFL